MDAYDRCTNVKKNLSDIVAMYGRGRELFRPPTYLLTYEDGEDSVYRNVWHIKFVRRGITQKKAYYSYFQNTAKV
jgi:hypothetical protein